MTYNNRSNGTIPALYRRLKGILGDLGLQDFEKESKATKGSHKKIQYAYISFTFDGIPKRAKIMIMPSYKGEGGFGIQTENRDTLVFVADHSKVHKRFIRKEMRRVIDIWDTGATSEELFHKYVGKSDFVPHIVKTDDLTDRNQHIDYIMYMCDKEGREIKDPIYVDVKSSLISKKIVDIRETDGVYLVDASDMAIIRLGAKRWVQCVIREIQTLEKNKLNKAS